MSQNVELVRRMLQAFADEVLIVNSVRDGKVVRGREYLSLDQALEAVGLSK
jgi:ketosteroid isomerase-like protein